MKTLHALYAVPFLLVAACSASPDQESTSSDSDAIVTASIVSRGMEWVDAKLHYCQASRGAYDGDSACWGYEGAAHRCDRPSTAAWNAYRSDCSGFVTFAWGLPAVGDGGYVTSEFAPYGNSFSHTINGIDLRPGDALNKTPDGHIVLFKNWISKGHSAEFMEEPGCSSATPYAHTFTSDVTISGDEVYIHYEGETFYAIRYNGSTASPGGPVPAPPPPGVPSGAADACSEGGGFCTDTLQCDNGHWIIRQDDNAACTKVENVSEACHVGGGYCTATLQCESGHWVPRSGDPAACTSGPGSAH